MTDEKEEEDIPRMMEISDEKKKENRKKRREQKREKVEGIEVTNITSNHGMPIQYFRCPWCGERNVGFDIFEGCRNDECEAHFKIMAVRR